MKRIKCLDCDEMFEVEAEGDAIQTMMPHYMQEHQKMMQGQIEETKEDWMKRLHEEWESAENI